MKIKLYLPYNTYDDGDFDTGYNMSNDQYFDMMREEENHSKNVAFDYVNGRRYNRKQGDASWNTGVIHKDGKSRLISADCVLHDDEDKDKTVDALVTECVSQDVGISVIHLDMDSIDEEFEEELNMWNDEHVNINQYKDKMGEEWVFKNEPVKNVFIEYVNNANETKYAEIINCRILEKMNIATYALLYDKITFKDRL